MSRRTSVPITIIINQHTQRDLVFLLLSQGHHSSVNTYSHVMHLHTPKSSPSGLPKITCKNDVSLFEAHDSQTGAFRRSMFTYFDSKDHAWIGENHHVRKQDLTVPDLASGLYKVADRDAFPQAPHDITLAISENLTTRFVKRPQIHCLLNEFEAPLVPQILLDEVHIFELLRRNPHPNIVAYHGCVVNRGYITGIALERLPRILDHRFLENASSFDERTFEHDLKSAVGHMHALGLAHNDLNPSNIGLNEDDRPIVIDLGSCKRFGEGLLSAGTPGWIEDDFDISKKEHDLLAIDKIIDWVRRQKDTMVGNHVSV